MPYHPRDDTEYTIPGQTPNDEPLLIVEFNQEWLQFLLALLVDFQNIYDWKGTEAEINDVHGQIDELISLFVCARRKDDQRLRIGDVIWSTRNDIGAGRLICNGAVYARTDEPDLYDAIDPAYRIDADFFRVPDFIGRFPQGNLTPGIEGGSRELLINLEDLPEHRHQTVRPIRSNTLFVTTENGNGQSVITDFAPSMTGANGSNDPLEFDPPYHTLIPLIVSNV